MTAAPADDRRVVANRLNGLGRTPLVAHFFAGARHGRDLAAEADRVIALGARKFPGVAEGQPILRDFLLPAVADDLPEKTVVVANAVTMRRDGERGHGIHEAGGETTETAIAERRIRLDAA